VAARWGRRDFIKIAGAAAAGSILPFGRDAAAGGDAGKPGPRVAVVTAADYAGKAEDVPADKAAALVSAAVAAVTGAAEGDAAWKALFTPADRVAIKVNTIAGAKLSTHPSIVSAIVAGVVSAGVKPSNVLVFDRHERELKRAGFAVGPDASGVRCLATDSPAIGYSEGIITSGSVGSLWSRAVTDFATAIVNVPLVKDHDLCGVSLGMKNLYGVIHNPNKYHDDGCDPYIADVSACPVIRGKMRLIVIDGLVAQVEGGPAYSPSGAYRYAGIIAGTDPVATDRVGCEEVERLRKEMGFKTLAEAGRAAKYIRTAADRGLGVADISKIEVVRARV